MGRQFTYFCLAEDLNLIQNEVFSPVGAQLVVANKVNGEHIIENVDRFGLELALMGTESIFLMLLPPKELRAEIRNGPWIDTKKSNLIEVGRCYTDGTILREARFWYETKYFEGSELLEKDSRFIQWAEGIYRGTKALLRRRDLEIRGHVYKEWFGESAWHQIERGVLKPVGAI